MALLNKTGVALRVVAAISLIAITGYSSLPSRAVEAPKTCVDNYTGETNDAGLAHGMGDRVWANCDQCSGLWSEGSMAYGTCISSGGDKYEGQFENGMFNGQGTLIWPDGGKYVGEWLDDKQHGQGTYIYPDGSKYVGEWLNGKQRGRGTETRPDGRKFVGSVNAGVRGKGTYTGPWPEGVSEVLDVERREKQGLADEQNRIEKRLAACDSFGS